MDLAGGYSSSGIDDSMPGNISIVARHGVHGPSDQPGAITVLQQSRNLAVGHYAAARNFKDEPIDLFKYPLEAGLALAARAAWFGAAAGSNASLNGA